MSQPDSTYDTEVREASEITVLTNLLADTNSIQLLRRVEGEKSFSFTATDNIHSVAMLLKVS